MILVIAIGLILLAIIMCLMQVSSRHSREEEQRWMEMDKDEK